MTTWRVPALVTRVVDGDTLVADLDLGWNLWHKGVKVRLAGVDCPELDTPEGKAARDFVMALLPVIAGVQPAPVTIVSKSLDKYGRTLAAVILPDGTSLAVKLIGAGLAQAS